MACIQSGLVMSFRFVVGLVKGASLFVSGGSGELRDAAVGAEFQSPVGDELAPGAVGRRG